MMRIHTPVACPACIGARPVPGTAMRISKPGRCCKYSAPRALDEREVQAETASSSEGLQHTVRAGLGEGIVPEPPSTSRGDRHEGLEGRYSTASGTRGVLEEEAPPAKEREAFWGRLAVLLLGVSWPHCFGALSRTLSGTSKVCLTWVRRCKLNTYRCLQLCLHPCCKCWKVDSRGCTSCIKGADSLCRALEAAYALV